MAKADKEGTKKSVTKKDLNTATLASDNPDIQKPRLVKLIVRNYRCIGTKPVEIDLDDIVVLVGGNNVGKSSILRAYELAMSQGSSKGKLKLEDFPNGKIDPANLPEIEIHTIVYDNSPGERWIETTAEGEKLVKERWVWKAEGDPIREGWDVEKSSWDIQVPWGAPNIANSRRPEPHRIDAFSPPSVQADEIKAVLMQAIQERVKNFRSDTGEASEFAKLMASIKGIQKQLLTEAQGQIDDVNKELSELIAKVFPGYIVDFDAKPEDNIENSISFFKGGSELLMGHKDGYLSTIDRQGSGARRTLLWTALKYIADNSKKKKEETNVRPNLLLLDEPEICLHPGAIRDACDVLYSLPQNGNWQVMITTHSPVFVDFSRDNTTIIRVEQENNGQITGTTVFRPSTVRLGVDDKVNLKMLNLCDPYVAEFLFGGKCVIVEGDTEYTAFKYVMANTVEKYRNVHIIRARGKATVASLGKILNHFGTSYSILHDCDAPVIATKKGPKKNPAWGTNSLILSAVNARPANIKVRLLASILNFENAYFGVDAEGEKPYHALLTIQQNPEALKRIEQLLDCLLDHKLDPPSGCLEWASLEELSKAVAEMELDASNVGES